MRILIVLMACALAACAGKPGKGAMDCAKATANPTGAGAVAAAAAAGQQVSNAPWAEDTARFNPVTGGGEGAVSSANRDTRSVASGGSQALMVAGANADAQAQGGGVNPAVAEAAKTVASYRAALQLCLADPTTSPERLESVQAGLMKAQETLAAAQSAAQLTHVTNNNFQGSTNNQFGMSSSSTDGRPDPESVEAVARGTADTLRAATARSTAPRAQPEFPEPAPAVPPVAPKTDGE